MVKPKRLAIAIVASISVVVAACSSGSSSTSQRENARLEAPDTATPSATGRIVKTVKIPGYSLGPAVTAPDGSVWFGLRDKNDSLRRSGLERIDATTYETGVTYFNDKSLLSDSLVVAQNGMLWYGATGSGLIQVGQVDPSSRKITQTIDYKMENRSGLTLVAQAPDGKIWVLISTLSIGTFYTIENGQLVKQFELGKDLAQAQSLTIAPNGIMWITHNRIKANGVSAVDPKTRLIVAKFGPCCAGIGVLDRAGSYLWIPFDDTGPTPSGGVWRVDTASKKPVTVTGIASSATVAVSGSDVWSTEDDTHSAKVFEGSIQIDASADPPAAKQSVTGLIGDYSTIGQDGSLWVIRRRLPDVPFEIVATKYAP